MYSAVFFDFDGVILDSVEIKSKAFATLFSCYGTEIQSAAVAYHESKGGLSRFEKFAYCYQNLLKQPLTDEKSRELGECFEKEVLQGVLEANFMPGAFKCLKALKAVAMPTFVVSGTPHDEVNYIVNQREIRSYFLEVHGSPRSKVDIIEDILYRYKLEPNCCLFVGDAITDYEAASSLALNFLGVVGEGNASPFPIDVPICSALSAARIHDSV